MCVYPGNPRLLAWGVLEESRNGALFSYCVSLCFWKPKWTGQSLLCYGHITASLWLALMQKVCAAVLALLPQCLRSFSPLACLSCSCQSLLGLFGRRWYMKTEILLGRSISSSRSRHHGSPSRIQHHGQSSDSSPRHRTHCLDSHSGERACWGCETHVPEGKSVCKLCYSWVVGKRDRDCQLAKGVSSETWDAAFLERMGYKPHAEPATMACSLPGDAQDEMNPSQPSYASG